MASFLEDAGSKYTITCRIFGDNGNVSLISYKFNGECEKLDSISNRDFFNRNYDHLKHSVYINNFL